MKMFEAYGTQVLSHKFVFPDLLINNLQKLKQDFLMCY